MRRLASLIAPVAVLLAAPAPAQDRMTPAEQAAVQLALDRGQLIHAYDQAAWHGTDDMFAKAKGNVDIRAAIGGWIVDGSANDPELLFFDKAATRALYVARFTDGGRRLVEGRLIADGEALSEPRQRLIAAQRSAIAAIDKAGSRPCAPKPFNTVVLPPATPDAPTLVYFLTPQTDMNIFPGGGHYRVEVAADGTASAPTPFARSCIALTKPKAGPKAQALLVSHLLDPTPTEVHVFTMLAARVPVFVAMPGTKRLWAIESTSGRARIQLVSVTKK